MVLLKATLIVLMVFIVAVGTAFALLYFLGWAIGVVSVIVLAVFLITVFHVYMMMKY